MHVHFKVNVIIIQQIQFLHAHTQLFCIQYQFGLQFLTFNLHYQSIMISLVLSEHKHIETHSNVNMF